MGKEGPEGGKVEPWIARCRASVLLQAGAPSKRHTRVWAGTQARTQSLSTQHSVHYLTCLPTYLGTDSMNAVNACAHAHAHAHDAGELTTVQSPHHLH